MVRKKRTYFFLTGRGDITTKKVAKKGNKGIRKRTNAP